jgi:hypothetical protein
MMSETTVEEALYNTVTDYDGAFIEQADGEYLFYHLDGSTDEDEAVYLGSPGNVKVYKYNDLKQAIDSEEVVLANAEDSFDHSE